MDVMVTSSAGPFTFSKLTPSVNCARKCMSCNVSCSVGLGTVAKGNVSNPQVTKAWSVILIKLVCRTGSPIASNYSRTRLLLYESEAYDIMVNSEQLIGILQHLTL